MLGFKRFETAAVTIQGIELAEKIKKHQFNLRSLTGNATTAPEIWAAVLGLEPAKPLARQKHSPIENLHQSLLRPYLRDQKKPRATGEGADSVLRDRRRRIL